MLSVVSVSCCGCYTVRAVPEDWTVDRGTAVVTDNELRQLHGYGNIYPKHIFCSQLLFSDFYFAAAGPTIQDGRLVHGSWTQTYYTRSIRFKDIYRVRIEYQSEGIPLALFFGGLVGPWTFNVEVDMRDGTTHVVKEWQYDWFDGPELAPGTFESWLNFFPFWIYPYHLFHGYEYAEAIDFLRQNAQENE